MSGQYEQKRQTLVDDFKNRYPDLYDYFNEQLFYFNMQNNMPVSVVVTTQSTGDLYVQS